MRSRLLLDFTGRRNGGQRTIELSVYLIDILVATPVRFSKYRQRYRHARADALILRNRFNLRICRQTLVSPRSMTRRPSHHVSSQPLKGSPAHPFWLSPITVADTRFPAQPIPYFIGLAYFTTNGVFPLAWIGQLVTIRQAKIAPP